MDLDKRYTPKVQRTGFEEFGDKYFRNLDEINYTEKSKIGQWRWQKEHYTVHLQKK